MLAAARRGAERTEFCTSLVEALHATGTGTRSIVIKCRRGEACFHSPSHSPPLLPIALEDWLLTGDLPSRTVLTWLFQKGNAWCSSWTRLLAISQHQIELANCFAFAVGRGGDSSAVQAQLRDVKEVGDGAAGEGWS